MRSAWLSRRRWPSHRPETGSVRDPELAEVDEPEPLVERRATLGARLEVRGHSLAVTAVERGTQQRRAEAATLKASGHTQIANVVVRLLEMAVLEDPLQSPGSGEPRAESTHQADRAGEGNRHLPPAGRQLEARTPEVADREHSSGRKHVIRKLDLEQPPQAPVASLARS